MNLYVWQEIKHATESYHSEGGVLVVADNEARARELALSQGAQIEPNESPDLVLGMDEKYEHVMIFPNAGCC